MPTFLTSRSLGVCLVEIADHLAIGLTLADDERSIVSGDRAGGSAQ
jgi:hypothetical protein